MNSSSNSIVKRKTSLALVDSSMRKKREGKSYYDVFISFRGKDTRNNFTSHVYEALCSKQIKAFIDSKRLRAGNEISVSLNQAIEISKLYLIIFSPNYASSKWCLMELEKILLCRRQHGKIVVPVFYKVDPSDVGHLLGNFRDAFSKHEVREEMSKVQGWRDALKEAVSLSGFHLNHTHKPEPEFIHDIVVDILKKLYQLTSPPASYSKVLVGIDPHIDQVMSLLRMTSPEAEICSVGIWGMGGIGKTTIAEVVVSCVRMSDRFDGCYLFHNVREEVKRYGEHVYWNSILRQILNEDMEVIHISLSLSLPFVTERLRRKKVFIVFDDVEESVFLQLQALADHKLLFGLGSKILMTSRDKQVLVRFCVDKVYEVAGLNAENGLKLFSLKAFKEEAPPLAYAEQSNRIVGYSQGNPLALTVLGSSLLGRDSTYWQSALTKMGKSLKPEILDLLRISYDVLSPKEKDTFLDIVLFFHGEDRVNVVELLESFYDYGTYSIITDLVDKCLLSLCQYKKLQVHDLLQELSFRIVDEEYSNGRCSRLYDPKEIKRVLTDKKGIDTVHGMYLNLSEAKGMSYDMDAVTEMVNLRWLRLSGWNDDLSFFKPRSGMFTFEWLTTFRRPHQVLPHLAYFRWQGCPLQSLPSTFYIKNVVVLNLAHSMLRQLWTGAQEFVNLKRLNLEQSTYLTETPDLSKAKNLEAINLFYCVCLVKLHPSIKDLPKLESLWLESCYSLCEVPSPFRSKVLKVVSLYGLTQLKTYPKFASKLQMLRLSVSDIEGVPECDDLILFRDVFLEKDLIRGEIPRKGVPKSVKQLNLITTDIEEVPYFIKFLTELESLYLMDNKKLKSISSRISDMESLHVLQIVNCELLSSIPELPVSLEVLAVENCVSLETVAGISNNSKLSYLQITNCSKLTDETCRDISDFAFHKIQLGEEIELCLTWSEIPERFPHRREGSSLTIQLPSDHGNSLVGFAFCVVVEPDSIPSTSERIGFTLDCKPHANAEDNNDTEMEDAHDAVLPLKVEIDLSSYVEPFITNHMVLRFLSSASDDTDRNLSDQSSKLLFQFGLSKHNYVVRKCGVCPIFNQHEEVVMAVQ